MSGPLLPYIKIPEIPLGLPKPFDSIKPFGVLVATGVYLGTIVATRHARQRKLDPEKMGSFIFHVVGLGFVGAHVFDAIFYTPDRLMRDPTYIFQLWAGLSSYGGFLGAIFGALLFKYRFGEKVLPMVDTVCSAFPLAWVFGRMGCASVHDHPGRETTSWLGVQYFHPGVRDPQVWWFLSDPNQTIGRFDLGLIEMVLTVPLAVAFAILWVKKPRPYGFYAGWQCVVYAPVRFVLDFFRVTEGHEADPRYFGLTPAQYACFGLAALGFFILRMSKSQPTPATWELYEAAFAAKAEGPTTTPSDADSKPKKARKKRRQTASAEGPSEAEPEAAVDTKDQLDS